MIHHEELIKIVKYDPKTGKFWWLKRPRQRACSPEAGSVNRSGYRQICLRQKMYKAHRLAWFYVHKSWPKSQIDHINGNRDDNRIENLREANFGQNQANSKIRINNRCGFKGVHFHKYSGLYMSRVMVNGRNILLGYFKTPKEAHKSYIEGAKKYFGKYARAA